MSEKAALLQRSKVRTTSVGHLWNPAWGLMSQRLRRDDESLAEGGELNAQPDCWIAYSRLSIPMNRIDPVSRILATKNLERLVAASNELFAGRRRAPAVSPPDRPPLTGAEGI